MKRALMCASLLFAIAPAARAEEGHPDTQPHPARPPYRILHIMSYHSPWRWTDGQLQGFKDAMQGLATTPSSWTSPSPAAWEGTRR